MDLPLPRPPRWPEVMMTKMTKMVMTSAVSRVTIERELQRNREVQL